MKLQVGHVTIFTTCRQKTSRITIGELGKGLLSAAKNGEKMESYYFQLIALNGVALSVTNKKYKC